MVIKILAISKRFWLHCDQLAFGAGKTMTVTVSPTFLLSRLSFSSEWHMKVLFRKPWKPLGEKSDFKMFCSFFRVCLVMEFLQYPKWHFLNYVLGMSSDDLLIWRNLEFWSTDIFFNWENRSLNYWSNKKMLTNQTLFFSAESK